MKTTRELFRNSKCFLAEPSGSFRYKKLFSRYKEVKKKSNSNFVEKQLNYK